MTSDQQSRPTERMVKADGRVPAALPFERAFVVQLRGDVDIAGGAVRGRIEHLSSGAAAVFDSVEELVAWMRNALGSSAAEVVRRDG